MKLIGEPIHVQLDADRKPARLYWNNRPYSVIEIVEKWHYAGQWWMDKDMKGIHRAYYRVNAKSMRGTIVTMEIYSSNRTWTLSRIAD